MRRSLHAGFTLLETLVVLMIFGFIVVGVMQLTKLGVDQVVRGDTEMRSSARLRFLDAVLYRVLAYAEPLETGNRAIVREHACDKSGIKFQGLLPAVAGGGLANMEIGFSSDGSGLVMRVERADGTVQSILLLDGIASGDLAYEVSPTDGPAPKWVERCDKAMSRVRAVRLKVTVDSIGDITRYVPLLLDRGRGCVFDTVALDCRPGT